MAFGLVDRLAVIGSEVGHSRRDRHRAGRASRFRTRAATPSSSRRLQRARSRTSTSNPASPPRRELGDRHSPASWACSPVRARRTSRSCPPQGSLDARRRHARQGASGSTGGYSSTDPEGGQGAGANCRANPGSRWASAMSPRTSPATSPRLRSLSSLRARRGASPEAEPPPSASRRFWARCSRRSRRSARTPRRPPRLR